MTHTLSALYATISLPMAHDASHALAIPGPLFDIWLAIATTIALVIFIGFACAKYCDDSIDGERKKLAAAAAKAEAETEAEAARRKAETEAEAVPVRWSEMLPVEGVDWTDADGDEHSVQAVAWSSGLGLDVSIGVDSSYETASLTWEQFDALTKVAAALRQRPGSTPNPEA